MSALGDGVVANKPMKTVPFNFQRFRESLKLRHLTIKAFCDPYGDAYKVFERDEKTIRRWKAKGTIPPDILDRIGRYLDVNPDYISGEYDRLFERIPNEDTICVLKAGLKPEKYPYLIKLQSTARCGKDLYELYLEYLLAIHHISIRQYDELPFDERKKISLELEQAIVPVLEKHFDFDARGRKGLQESWYLEAMIDCYDPDEPEE